MGWQASCCFIGATRLVWGQNSGNSPKEYGMKMNIKTTVRTVSLLTLAIGLAVNGNSQSFLTNGLFAYYPFNGNANDASRNGHNGTNYGGVLVPDRFGYTNQAYRFDGTNTDHSDTNSFIDLSQNRPITGVQTTFSICGWINPRYIPQLPRDESIPRGIYHHRADWADIGVRINNSPWYITPTTLEFCTVSGVHSGNQNDNLFASILIPTNAWTSFVATYDGATKCLYINGTLNVSVPYTFPANWDTGFMGEGIGGNVYWQAETFDGVIDDIRIYNRALSTNEVAQLYAIESGPRVDLIKAVKPSFSYLWVGTNYQMQVSGDMNTWTNYGAVFTATNTSMIYPQYWDVDNWNKLFFRLQVSP